MKKLGAAAAALLFLAAAAPAPDAETRADIRCFIAVSSLMESEDEAMRQAGSMASQYYLGRIDGRVPDLDLESAVAAELPIDQAALQALMQSCGAELEKRGQEVVAVGKRLTARGL